MQWHQSHVNREYVVAGTSVFTQDSTKWIDMNGDGLADVVTRDDELNWSVLINKSFDALIIPSPLLSRSKRDFLSVTLTRPKTL
ncbi:MAG TPA: hypothetical protein VFO10_07480 [Oligoflexus sp.]|uniref:hypothetical protein n=1 Tax=Oligoflexus sp. TaxID=1971216 RepID=UPI002D807597|nr:hypothetical protein [Oligoflexus sp.]HET9237074.1 hypothetical protein [Oligoflexus sp.]